MRSKAVASFATSVVTTVMTSLVLLSLIGCEKKDSVAAGKGTSSDQQSGAKADNNGGGAKQANRPQPVSTTLTRIETVPITLEAQGNVIALDEVDVRPQKNGTIQQIHFKEGNEVKQGQLLFTLDDRDDAANVKRAEANVAGSQATLAATQRDLQRTQDLSARNFVSPSALDTARDKVDAATAALAQNKAALEQARVSQSYTVVRAPFDGRAGLINVRPGSLVTSNATSTSMVKITRMNPIGISFSLPERDLSTLLTSQRQGRVKVRVDLDNEHSLRGEVIFIDSSVDRTSGTIAVKAQLDNTERRVWPGQYVTVKIVAGEIKDAVVLPSQAIINGPNGRLVYVVKDDQTVASQPVELVRIVDQKAVIKGIDAGVKVVLEGGQNLRPGVKVQETKSVGRGQRGASQSGPQDDPTMAAPANQQAGKDAGKTRNKPTDKSSEVKGEPETKGNQSATSANKAQPKADGATSSAQLPEGFHPRDPDAWAKMSDEQRAAIIERWRARQAEQGNGGAARQ